MTRDRSGLYNTRANRAGAFGRVDPAQQQELLSKQFSEYLQTMGITQPTTQDVLSFEQALLGDELYGPQSGLLKAGIYDIDKPYRSGFRGAEGVTDTFIKDKVKLGDTFYDLTDTIPVVEYEAQNPYSGQMYDYKKLSDPAGYLMNVVNKVNPTLGNKEAEVGELVSRLMRQATLQRDPEQRTNLIKSAAEQFKKVFGTDLSNLGYDSLRGLFGGQYKVNPTRTFADLEKYSSDFLPATAATKQNIQEFTPTAELGDRLGTEFVQMDEFTPRGGMKGAGYNPYAIEGRVDPTDLQLNMLSGVYQQKFSDPANLRNFLLTGQTAFSDTPQRTSVIPQRVSQPQSRKNIYETAVQNRFIPAPVTAPTTQDYDYRDFENPDPTTQNASSRRSFRGGKGTRVQIPETT